MGLTIGLLPINGSDDGDPLREPSQLGEGLWPLCDWGCAIVSLVDCRTDDRRVWGFDPNNGERQEDSLFEDEFTLAEWLHHWATDRLIQPTLVEDEATGGWRGATQAEMAEWF